MSEQKSGMLSWAGRARLLQTRLEADGRIDYLRGPRSVVIAGSPQPSRRKPVIMRVVCLSGIRLLQDRREPPRRRSAKASAHPHEAGNFGTSPSLAAAADRFRGSLLATPLAQAISRISRRAMPMSARSRFDKQRSACSVSLRCHQPTTKDAPNFKVANLAIARGRRLGMSVIWNSSVMTSSRFVLR